ncbi:hypothetical protein HU200_057655 [Digitaria exilis]|uniref:F-box domain-containing protein n=1 Tax=Digitaria exilis TaxID=1010633 RepID=A0A835E4S5_9POAL|nr:hypothetical protein HU200_057655 [Digitaria exilis]
MMVERDEVEIDEQREVIVHISPPMDVFGGDDVDGGMAIGSRSKDKSSGVPALIRFRASVNPSSSHLPFVMSEQAKKMDCKELSAAYLTDDLVVEILSRLPFKSFSRFKCVCKAWLAFSFDPHYSQKLPKVSDGFFYQDRHNSAIQFVSLSEHARGFDGTLSFLPGYEHLEFVDCCNGLVLCEYRSNYTSRDIFRFIVCNPATQEWKILPETQRKPDGFYYTTKLGFDPSRSPHFYVFNFHNKRGPYNFTLVSAKLRGCLGQYSGILHYAVAEEDGCTILIWSHDYCDPYMWTITHHLNMKDAFGRDDFVHYEEGFIWTCDYGIIALDLERDVIFLFDEKTNKLLSYGISTGKLSEIKDSPHWYFHYVPCYLKLPEPEPVYDDVAILQAQLMQAKAQLASSGVQQGHSPVSHHQWDHGSITALPRQDAAKRPAAAAGGLKDCFMPA